LFWLAVRTGLEPATHGVTGRYSNQLNYRTKLFLHKGRYSNPDLSGNYRTKLFLHKGRYSNPDLSGNYRTFYRAAKLTEFFTPQNNFCKNIFQLTAH
jgi:hypothetical protein